MSFLLRQDCILLTDSFHNREVLVFILESDICAKFKKFSKYIKFEC